MDFKLQGHAEFIGLYSVDSINAKSLVASIKDVLRCMGLPLSNCTGQCHDGAPNMSGAKGGVTAQLTAIESQALYNHCYCHALNITNCNLSKPEGLGHKF